MPTNIYPNRTTIRILTNYTVNGQPDIKPEPLGSISFKRLNDSQWQHHNMNEIQELIQCLLDIYSHDPVKIKIEMEVTND